MVDAWQIRNDIAQIVEMFNMYESESEINLVFIGSVFLNEIIRDLQQM